VFSFLRQLTTWHSPHSLLRRALLIDCCCPPAVQQSVDISAAGPTAANPPQRRAAAEWTNGLMDWTVSGKSGPKDQVALHYYCALPSHWCTTHEVSKL